MRPHDTTADAHAVQVAIWRRMGEPGRLRVALDMSDAVRRLAADGIRLRHPEYDEEQVCWALYRHTLGDALFMQAFPHAPRLEP